MPDIVESALLSRLNADADTGLFVGSGLESNSTKSGFDTGLGLGSSRDLANVPVLSIGVPPRRWPDDDGFKSASGRLALSSRTDDGWITSKSLKSSSRSDMLLKAFVIVMGLIVSLLFLDESFTLLLPTSPDNSSPFSTLFILLATSHPSSVSVYFRNGLPLSCTRSLFTSVLIEFHAVYNFPVSLGIVNDESQYCCPNSMICALVRLCSESSGKEDRAMTIA